MKMKIPSLVTLLSLGCVVENSNEIDGLLWDTEVVATTDGIYAALPHSGALVRIQDNNTYKVIDLNGAEPVRMVTTPDGSKALIFARWPQCTNDNEDIVDVSDCDEDELEWNAELVVVEDGVAGEPINIPGHMNALAFTEDGSKAVAYLDYSEDTIIEISGIVDLSEVVIIDLEGDQTQNAVSIGFSPDNILFNADGTKAVILSRSKVVLVDMVSFDVLVEFPLVLDADQTVNPSGAVLTEDGTKVLVSVSGSSDMYVLNLEDGNYSIDMEELSGAPADLAVAKSTEQTLVVYGSLAQVDFVDNSSGDLQPAQTIDLDEPVSSVLMASDFAVLYNNAGGDYYDVVKLDLDTTEDHELRVENPIHSMQMSESEQYAVAVLRPEDSWGGGLSQYADENWGLAVINLIDGEEEVISLVVESQPVGVELIEDTDASTTYALVLMDGVDSVLKIDLARPSAYTEVELEAPPVGIGALPDATGFYITHESALGLISFLNPANNEITTAHGFAVVELLDDDTLPRREGEEE